MNLKLLIWNLLWEIASLWLYHMISFIEYAAHFKKMKLFPMIQHLPEYKNEDSTTILMCWCYHWEMRCFISWIFGIRFYVWSILNLFSGRNFHRADPPSKLWQNYQMPRRNRPADSSVCLLRGSQLGWPVTWDIWYSDRPIQNCALHLVNAVASYFQLPWVGPTELWVNFFLFRTMRQLHIAMTLQHLSDSEILQTCSTSPSAEAPDFLDNIRR